MHANLAHQVKSHFFHKTRNSFLSMIFFTSLYYGCVRGGSSLSNRSPPAVMRPYRPSSPSRHMFFLAPFHALSKARESRLRMRRKWGGGRIGARDLTSSFIFLPSEAGFCFFLQLLFNWIRCLSFPPFLFFFSHIFSPRPAAFFAAKGVAPLPLSWFHRKGFAPLSRCPVGCFHP